MRVAVLGAGNGGLASAFDFAQHGHDVALYAAPEFGANVVAVDEAGGISASGDLQGFAPVRYAGHDVAEALSGAELVVVVGPAYGLYLAGLPRSGTDRLHELIADVWPAVQRADSVFQTSLQNGNPVIHPPVTLLNAGLLERTGGGFLFYEEGVTESVGRLIEAVDDERIAIAAALGVTILSDPELGVTQGYMREADYSTGYSTAPGFLGIGAQSRLDHRYLTEDVGYSLVFLTDLAARLGVPTRVMDAVIAIASVVLARDFRAEGKRTLATLGLEDMSAEQLAAL
jgi:opine dehydrogenase